MRRIAKIARKFLPLLGALLIVVAIYVPSLTTGYFADDFDFAVRMPQMPISHIALRSTDGTLGGGSYRPLTIGSYWLTMRYDQSPFFNHAVSLAIYLAMLGALYAVIRSLFSAQPRWFAAAGVLLIGLMPIRVEPVVWVAARADLIAALFALSGLALYLRGFGKSAVILFLLSLGAKEFWIGLAPVVFLFAGDGYSKKDRLTCGAMYVVGVLGWFGARYYITQFGVGGYSITEGQNIFGVQHIANEVLSFFLASWNFGVFQSWIVRFSQFYWFITTWIVGAALVIAGRYFARSAGGRLIAAALAATLAPILMLGVPFIRPGASVAEQRYWFAPAIFLALLGLHALRTHKRNIQIAVFAIVICVFGYGTAANIRLYRDAAVYRDEVLSGWKTLVGEQGIYTQVALLPDSWYGVHLLASPFFERALEYEKQSKPSSVSAWYQHCTALCREPITTDRKNPESVLLLAQNPRIFSNSSRGLRYDATIQLENGTTLAVWSGASWIQLSAEGGENCLH